MRSEEIPEIATLPMFAAMQPELRDSVFAAAFLQVFPPALRLFEVGARADFLHILVDGLVELYTASAGREVTVQLVRPVSSFILAAAYTDQRYLMSARTLSASRILMIPSSLLRDAIVRDSAFAQSALTEIALRYRTVIRALTDMKVRQTLERLANFLLLESKAQGGAAQFTLPAEKRVIASLLGMAPENLSRACGALADHGALINGPTVRIVDRAKLTALARPLSLIHI